MNRRRQSNTEQQRRARIALSLRLSEWLQSESDGVRPNSAAITKPGADTGGTVLAETKMGCLSQDLDSSRGDDLVTSSTVLAKPARRPCRATPSAIRAELARRSMSNGQLAMATGVSQHMILLWLDSQCPKEKSEEVAIRMLQWLRTSRDKQDRFGQRKRQHGTTSAASSALGMASRTKRRRTKPARFDDIPEGPRHGDYASASKVHDTSSTEDEDSSDDTSTNTDECSSDNDDIQRSRQVQVDRAKAQEWLGSFGQSIGGLRRDAAQASCPVTR